jgi:hypothetical protein
MFCSKHWEICLDGDRVIGKHTNMYQVIYQNGPGNRRSMIVDREGKARVPGRRQGLIMCFWNLNDVFFD